ncbi:Uncharacterised protein [Vibrio cholerae]|nr:Uncharacterised protein [Vibrio cholerae]
MFRAILNRTLDSLVRIIHGRERRRRMIPS